MPTTAPEWQTLALYAVAAAVILLLLQRIPVVGRIIRLESKHLVFDAQIAPGNSGGPLVDKHGRMIGMSIETYEGNGYALPMDLILSVVDGWLKNMKLEEVWQHQKYAPFSQRFIKDPLFVIAEAGVIAGTSYLILRKPEQMFGEPPPPP